MRGDTVKVALVDPDHGGTVTAVPPGPFRVRKPMSSSAIALRRRRRAVPLDPAEARDRLVRRRINAVWGLLYLNTP
jgi:hypothetical protein